jgi:membrane protease YdiL (CAAX protease family)
MTELVEERKSIFPFFLITFIFSWLLWLPSLLSSFGLFRYLPLFNLLVIVGSFGPFIAAFSLTYRDRGIEGVKSLWRKGWHCEKKLFMLISLVLIPILFVFSLYLAGFFEKINLYELQNRYQYPIGYFFGEIIAVFFIGGPFQEEFGWRGYAIDRLQSKWNAFESSIILGGIWSFWHYPLFFISGTSYINQSFFSFTISSMAISILFTWLHNNTNGSILVAMIFHASINLTYILFQHNITVFGSVFFIILLDIAIVTILIIFGQEDLKRTKKKEKIIV